MKIFIALFLAVTAYGAQPPRVVEFWYATEVASWNEAAGHFVYNKGEKIMAPTAEADTPYIVITRITGDFVLIPASAYAVERAQTYEKAAARADQTGGRVTTAPDGAILVYYRK